MTVMRLVETRGLIGIKLMEVQWPGASMFESMRMLTLRRVVFTAAFGVMLASCSGVYGPKGNDAGGIIP